ncbi:hypothetical protein DF185_09385 [Marinifilum breve]|uniref:DUF4861 domain-containing protein n=1 Tax=Marinifilum breve TaxID=2184082 RepID=A0A2V4A2V6_9BACT|nr:hypothetical protein [Marinifilum breve]PXY01670.1 hypothetical protein DF185_09385 [Marinifilum breve]
MMRKFTFLMACAAFFATTIKVSAQETRVTKQIKTFEWMDVAVVDGNQVEGGAHVYNKFADLTSLKPKQQKVGMLVTILDPKGDGTEPGATYRLLNAGLDATNVIKPVNYERLDGIIVANITDRDALLGADKAKLAKGTIVGVLEGETGEKVAFLYTASPTAGEEWIQLGGAGTAGFILIGQGAVLDTKGYKDGSATAGAIDFVADKDNKLNSFIEAQVVLTKAGGACYVAFPEAWNKPTFYVKDATGEYPISDCWTVSHNVKKHKVDYQVWTADIDFAKDMANDDDLTLIVR